MSINEKIRNNQITVTEIVKDKKANFQSYCGGLLNYKTEDGFEFSIPTEDTGNGFFNSEHKAIELMRWIRKQYNLVKES